MILITKKLNSIESKLKGIVIGGYYDIYYGLSGQRKVRKVLKNYAIGCDIYLNRCYNYKPNEGEDDFLSLSGVGPFHYTSQELEVLSNTIEKYQVEIFSQKRKNTKRFIPFF